MLITQTCVYFYVFSASRFLLLPVRYKFSSRVCLFVYPANQAAFWS